MTVIPIHVNAADSSAEAFIDKLFCISDACQSNNSVKNEDVMITLGQHTDTMSRDLIQTVSTAINCVNKENFEHNSILTVIDYSQPSYNKRLWVFDLKSHELLYHTYVSHAIKSGLVNAYYYSNVRNSKANSIGVFRTENTYYGRYGLGLRLQGLEPGFNDNAAKRSIVMHPVWYVNEDFIKKYGRLGRSWGCPALPIDQANDIMHTIKDNSLLIVYHPSEQWLEKSEFLTCEDFSLENNIDHVQKMPKSAANEKRDSILYLDTNKNNRREENEAVMVMSADRYQKTYKKRAPLKRMLRRQINNKEYIVLVSEELKQLDSNADKVINDSDPALQWVDFVIPVVKKLEVGAYRTEFHSVDLGDNKEVELSSIPVLKTSTSKRNIKSTNVFIRWLGL